MYTQFHPRSPKAEGFGSRSCFSTPRFFRPGGPRHARSSRDGVECHPKAEGFGSRSCFLLRDSFNPGGPDTRGLRVTGWNVTQDLGPPARALFVWCDRSLRAFGRGSLQPDYQSQHESPWGTRPFSTFVANKRASSIQPKRAPCVTLGPPNPNPKPNPNRQRVANPKNVTTRPQAGF
jgi:hypothetical protein